MFDTCADNLWTRWVARKFLGFLHFGARMNVIRLSDRKLILYSPTTPSPELKTSIDALGEVAYLVAPNTFHHLSVGDYCALYPGAKLFAPRGLSRKRPDLKIDVFLDEHAQFPWSSELDHCHVLGSPLSETVLYHRSSRTLICADLLQNFPTMVHTPTRLYFKAMGCFGAPGVSRALRWSIRDRKAARFSVEKILAWDIERIVVGHGEIVTTNAKAALHQAYCWLLG